MIQTIDFKRLDPRATLPTKASRNAAGLDLYAIEDVNIEVGERKAVRTGLSVEIPIGYYGRVAPRSGLAIDDGIDVLGGVIDGDYRGEILCILINHGQTAKTFRPGDRVAQLLFEAHATPRPRWVEELGSTLRDGKGFGSSGK